MAEERPIPLMLPVGGVTEAICRLHRRVAGITAK
jgi:hypothetical protein